MTRANASNKPSTSPPPPPVVKAREGGLIATPNPNDVLCGRGGRINSHEGNVKFRDIVTALKPTYLAPTTKKVEKAVIAAEVVTRIRNQDPPGRFLREDEGGSGMWVDIGDERARKKAGQALREDAPDIRAEMTTVTEEQIKAAAAAAAANAVAQQQAAQQAAQRQHGGSPGGRGAPYPGGPQYGMGDPYAQQQQQFQQGGGYPSAGGYPGGPNPTGGPSQSPYGGFSPARPDQARNQQMGTYPPNMQQQQQQPYQGMPPPTARVGMPSPGGQYQQSGYPSQVDDGGGYMPQQQQQQQPYQQQYPPQQQQQQQWQRQSMGGPPSPSWGQQQTQTPGGTPLGGTPPPQTGASSNVVTPVVPNQQQPFYSSQQQPQSQQHAMNPPPPVSTGGNGGGNNNNAGGSGGHNPMMPPPPAPPQLGRRHTDTGAVDSANRPLIRQASMKRTDINNPLTSSILRRTSDPTPGGGGVGGVQEGVGASASPSSSSPTSPGGPDKGSSSSPGSSSQSSSSSPKRSGDSSKGSSSGNAGAQQQPRGKNNRKNILNKYFTPGEQQQQQAQQQAQQQQDLNRMTSIGSSIFSSGTSNVSALSYLDNMSLGSSTDTINNLAGSIAGGSGSAGNSPKTPEGGEGGFDRREFERDQQRGTSPRSGGGRGGVRGSLSSSGTSGGASSGAGGGGANQGRLSPISSVVEGLEEASSATGSMSVGGEDQQQQQGPPVSSIRAPGRPGGGGGSLRHTGDPQHRNQQPPAEMKVSTTSTNLSLSLSNFDSIPSNFKRSNSFPNMGSITGALSDVDMSSVAGESAIWGENKSLVGSMTGSMRGGGAGSGVGQSQIGNRHQRYGVNASSTMRNLMGGGGPPSMASSSMVSFSMEPEVFDDAPPAPGTIRASRYGQLHTNVANADAAALSDDGSSSGRSNASSWLKPFKNMQNIGNEQFNPWQNESSRSILSDISADLMALDLHLDPPVRHHQQQYAYQNQRFS